MSTKTTGAHENAAPKRVIKTHKATPENVGYKVKSGGYSETFKTEDAALKQIDILKKRAIKEQAPIMANITEIRNGVAGKEVHSLKIAEDFYE